MAKGRDSFRQNGLGKERRVDFERQDSRVREKVQLERRGGKRQERCI